MEGQAPPPVTRTSRLGLDRFTLGIVAVTALLVLGTLLAVSLQRRDTGPADESQPSGVVHNYYLALLRDDPKSAYAYLSREEQFRNPYERFASRWRGRTPPDLRILREVVEGETARVWVSWSYPRNGFPPFLSSGTTLSEETVVLKREDGAWRIAQRPAGPL